MFSDEATFHLNVKFDVRIWGTEQLHLFVQHEIYLKLNVFYTISQEKFHKYFMLLTVQGTNLIWI